MASLKKFASQTIWYGLSAILPRFLNYLLTPYLTAVLSTGAYGEMSLYYSAIPFLNVLFTYGMETAYFRFSNNEDDEGTVFSTGASSLLLTTLGLSLLILLFRDSFAFWLKVQEHPQLITWMAGIIAFDTIAALPFARLRNQGRPRKYAFIRLLNVLVNIGFTVFFYSAVPRIAAASPGSWIAHWYDPALGAGYVLLANLIASAVTVLLLLPEFLSIRLRWNGLLRREMLVYALPIMVAGFGGVINETFDRIMLSWWSSAPTELARKAEVGIYSGCYKLSILITLFIQAFKMGAEPFFFQQAKGEDGPRVFARMMKFFVLTLCLMFLVVELYIDVWKHFIQNKTMWEGLRIVPLLLIANMCLGVYYNLSIWYKLSKNTRAGATITLIGALITLVINYLFIPRFSYVACATATLSCYGAMMLISYFWGQKVYPVPYDAPRLLRFFGVMLALFAVHLAFRMLGLGVWINALAGTFLIGVYCVFILFSEKEELRRLPVVGRFLR